MTLRPRTCVRAGALLLLATAFGPQIIAGDSPKKKPNQPPTVTITAPGPGATFNARATIIVDANAADGDGTIKVVRFFAGSHVIGTARTAPYRAEWEHAPAGTY